MQEPIRLLFFISVGGGSPTEINAPRGMRSDSDRNMSASLTRITRQVSRTFDLNPGSFKRRKGEWSRNKETEQMERELPEAFCEKMRRMLEREYPAFVESYGKSRDAGIAVQPVESGF